MAHLSRSPIAQFGGRFTEAHACRLLWRAGFGPTPGQAAKLAARGLDGAVASLTRPAGRARLIGAAPHNDKGQALDPINTWGDDHCWWLDRMVRSNQQLIERMTLIWHSWFATSEEASNAQLMIRQNRMMRSHALGNFHQLLLDVTKDPAMLLWLNGSSNNKYSPNENYGREMLELFTLGADRGYDQDDVHQNARALTGWTNDWSQGSGPTNFHFDPTLHDDGVKTIFGQSGRFTWVDSCRLAVQHRTHPSFFVNKLWGYLIGTPIPGAEARALERAYVASGFEVRPIVEAILRHPLFYEGPRLVIPPVVFCAGMLRASRQTIVTTDWAWVASLTGQVLFQPPNVSGWNYADWLDTARWAGRLTAVNTALNKRTIDTNSVHYPSGETPSQAVANALRYWGNPTLSPGTRGNLEAFSRRVEHGITATWEVLRYRELRQNALRALIPMTPEWQTA
ncbi:MAG TPA: DUF1800 family protein [Solirubrobacteraceae bacterium]|nr:DUF1800 family protein [Solirubrobacteraceae bacterium]